jgi:hypothetical protein
VVGQHEVGLLTEKEAFFQFQALPLEPPDFLDQAEGVHDAAVTNNADFPGTQKSRRQQVKNKLLLANNDRVPGVIPSLGTYDGIVFCSENIDDLAFAFISPLGAYEYGIHVIGLPAYAVIFEAQRAHFIRIEDISSIEDDRRAHLLFHFHPV